MCNGQNVMLVIHDQPHLDQRVCCGIPGVRPFGTQLEEGSQPKTRITKLVKSITSLAKKLGGDTKRAAYFVNKSTLPSAYARKKLSCAASASSSQEGVVEALERASLEARNYARTLGAFMEEFSKYVSGYAQEAKALCARSPDVPGHDCTNPTKTCRSGSKYKSPPVPRSRQDVSGKVPAPRRRFPKQGTKGQRWPKKRVSPPRWAVHMTPGARATSPVLHPPSSNPPRVVAPKRFLRSVLKHRKLRKTQVPVPPPSEPETPKEKVPVPLPSEPETPKEKVPQVRGRFLRSVLKQRKLHKTPVHVLPPSEPDTPKKKAPPVLAPLQEVCSSSATKRNVLCCRNPYQCLHRLRLCRLCRLCRAGP